MHAGNDNVLAIIFGINSACITRLDRHYSELKNCVKNTNNKKCILRSVAGGGSFTGIDSIRK